MKRVMRWNDACTRALTLAGELPLLLVLTVVIGFFLAPSMYPGGCLCYLVGLIVLLLFVIALKQLSAALFPASAWPFRPKRPDLPWTPGFPSSHAATMAFFTTTLALMPCGYSHVRRVVLASLLGLLTLAVCVQRYSTDAHTAAQLVGGLLIGVGAASLYAALVSRRRCDACGDGTCR